MATVNGTANKDELYIDSGKSNDTLLGLAGDDYLDATTGAGNNILKGGDGNDALYAYTNDQLFGEAGNDTLSSDGNGKNILDGGDGNDIIFADQNDTVFGGAGNDVIYGGLGGNTFTGGQGNDVFWLANVDLPTKPNIITDFNQAEDTIRVNLAGVTKFTDLTVGKAGNDATLSFGNIQLAIVKNTFSSYLNLTTVVVDGSASNNKGGVPAPILAPVGSGSGIFQMSQGSGSETVMRFTKLSHQANYRNELGVFAVDDNNGTINGIAPDQASYLTEVFKRSQVVFSALSDGSVDASLDGVSTRTVSLPVNAKLGFYLAVNSTYDDKPSMANMVFSFPFSSNGFQNSLVTQTGGVTQIAFEDNIGGGDKDFNDLVVQIENATSPGPLGISLQGSKEIFDLSTVAVTSKATFEVQRDAGYDNHVGFYKIEDVLGTIKVGTTLLKPNDEGYRQAAVQGRLAGIDLAGTNGQTVTSTGNFEGGAIYAPFLIANAVSANSDFSNVYTAYSLGNADKVDHIRLLGDNTFGFEDLFGGGDRDFNDIIVKAVFQ